VTGAAAGPAAWPRCSFVAEDAGDPREGSAPPAERWFLVEHPGPWGRAALTQSGVDPAAVRVLSAWAAAGGGRVLLVRRPGRPARRGGPRRWFRVDSRPGREEVRGGWFDAERELDPDAPGAPVDGPLHLVCAHGRHDTCCAVRGRPLAAALDPERTWESSHLGGCRFAPALVLLPHGFVLGGVPAAEGPAVAAAYRAGRIDPRFVRGRSCFPPAVQAAQHHARAALGVLDVAALAPVRVEQEGPRWTVALADPACTVVLHERRVDTGRPLTCAATAPGWMRVFDAVRVSTG
jgi:hypothetical protein